MGLNHDLLVILGILAFVFVVSFVAMVLYPTYIIKTKNYGGFQRVLPNAPPPPRQIQDDYDDELTPDELLSEKLICVECERLKETLRSIQKAVLDELEKERGIPQAHAVSDALSSTQLILDKVVFNDDFLTQTPKLVLGSHIDHKWVKSSKEDVLFCERCRVTKHPYFEHVSCDKIVAFGKNWLDD